MQLWTQLIGEMEAWCQILEILDWHMQKLEMGVMVLMIRWMYKALNGIWFYETNAGTCLFETLDFRWYSMLLQHPLSESPDHNKSMEHF